MMQLSSVRLRLILWNVGVLAFILLALGVVLRYSLQRSLALGVDDELESVAGGFRESRYPLDDLSTYLVARHHPPPGLRLGDRKSLPGDGDPMAILFPKIANGTLSVNLPRLLLLGKAADPNHVLSPVRLHDVPWDAAALRTASAGRDVFSTVHTHGQLLRVLSVPIRYRNHVEGAIQFARPLEEIHHEVDHLTKTLLALAPWALLVASLGGAFLTDRALRPVRAVTQAAGRIEAANLSGRLTVSGSDEFAQLARTFNGMLHRLEEAFGRLELANDQLRRFTADASHELRTPLTIIKAHTSLALAQPHTADEYHAALEIVDRAVDRTSCLVQDLLLLARSDAGQLDIARAPVAVTEILEYAVESARRPDSSPIRLRLPDPPPTVRGDANSLIRLFANLVANAVRHTPKDGTITLAVAAQGTQVVIDVIDTGEGIAPEHLPHVRERFYRVDDARARAQGGTGLGLSICQSIVESHGGRMTIDSVLGEGTTVTVTLPGVPVSGTTAHASSYDLHESGLS